MLGANADERRFIAIADFAGAPGGKLAFKAQAQFVFVKEITKDWFQMRAVDDGRTGLVPTNYIKPYQASADELSMEPDLARGQSGSPPTGKAKHTGSVSTLERARGSASAVAMVVIADFVGAPPKLSLKKGDEVKLVARKTADWYEVITADGRKGYAPASFLKDASNIKVVFRAIADYSGGGNRLSFVKGEVLTLAKRLPGIDWFEVQNSSGETGFVPVTYIEEFDPDAGPPVMYRAVANYAAAAGRMSLVEGELVTCVKKVADEWFDVIKAESKERGIVPAPFLEAYVPPVVYFKVVSDYSGDGGDKMPLKRGEKLKLVQTISDEWVEVERGSGIRGVAPLTYLREVPADDAPKIFYRAVARFEGSGAKLSLFKGDELRLIRKINDNWVEVQKTGSGETGIAPVNYMQVFTPTKRMYVVIADYRGKGEVLSIQRGDLLEFVEKLSDDWLEMQTTKGDSGLVPVTYVEEVPTDDPMPPPPGSPMAKRRLSRTKSTQKSKRVSMTSASGRLASAVPAAEGSPVASWTESNVAAWLIAQGPPVTAFAAVFAKNDIDGATLAGMTEQDMAEIGVDSFRVRRQIVLAVQKLQGTRGAAVSD